jgi:hypothetical protein
MDCDYDSESDTPPEVTERANAAIATIIPGKSKIQNERAYIQFREWCTTKKCSKNIGESAFSLFTLWSTFSMLKAMLNVVAGQSATIRFGRGRRPRGPTYARGTIRSLFEDQEQATQRTAYDVATRPPCRNLFWGRSFRNNSVCLCRQSIHFEFIGSGFIFVYRITFSFISVSLSVSLSVFVCFFRGFFRVFIVESLCQPVLGRLESHMLAPKF